MDLPSINAGVWYRDCLNHPNDLEIVMSYRDPYLSGKWLSEAEWRSYNDHSSKYLAVDSRLTIRRLVEEVRKLNQEKENLRAKLDDYSEKGYQQLVEDEEWVSLHKAKLEARKYASVGREKLERIANEVSVPRLFDLKSAVSTLKKIKDILEDK